MTYTLIPLKVLCLLTIFCLYGSLSYASVNSKPFVVPAPLQIQNCRE